METLQLIVSGIVQGVGFRYHTKMLADKMKITGTVHNNDDGTVTIIATAPKKDLDLFIEQIKIPYTNFVKITSVQTISLPIKEFTNFAII